MHASIDSYYFSVSLKRVRRSTKANQPTFSQRSDMKCLLRTGDIHDEAWNSLQSIPIVSPCGPEVLHHGSSDLIHHPSHMRIASLYFIPLASIQAVRHSSLIRKRSTPERYISPMRSKQIEPSVPPTNDVNFPHLIFPVRSSSPDPTAQSTSSTSIQNSVGLPPNQRRSSVSRSRLSSPDLRLRAASFFAVKSSPCPSIEEAKESPFTIPICDILLVELFNPSSNIPSYSIDHAHILITTNSGQLYEITFFTMDSLDIMYAFLCAMVPMTRRNVLLEESKMMEVIHDEPIVHDIANFEANAVEDYFRNETYFERMSRRSSRLIQRLCDCT